MALSAGAQVGPYEILGFLAAGGMGEVYRARDPRLGRGVAIKILPESFSQDRDRVARMEQEARAAGALNHPNVLAVYDVGVHEGRTFVVSELLEGQTLRDRLRGGPLPPRKAVELGVQIAQGLAAAHEKGIIHRDLKPENLFVGTDGRLKILDFGIAKQMRSGGAEDATETGPHEALQTDNGAVMGTIGYMSPEQVRTQPLDARSDLFSLGAILFEMLSGRRAFQRPSAVETMNAILKEEPPELSELAPGLPPAVERIVRRCLEKGRTERFHSAHDLAFALESLSLGAAQRPPEKARASARRFLQFALATIAVAALALGARALLSPSERPGLDAYRFSPLATAAGYEGAASWSPDGRNVAYVAETDGLLQLYTRSLDSSMPARITRSLADCQEPFWSPDGTRLYYISLAGSSLALWSVGATGGTPQVVVRNAATAALSPDGQTLALLREDSHQGNFSLSLWISSPPGSEPVRYPEPSLASRRFGRGFLRFSPDGRTLGLWGAATSEQKGYSSPEFWVLPQPKGPPRRALTSLSVMPDPAPFSWMPDGRRIVFAGQFLTLTPGTHLWIADAESGQLRPLTASSGNEQYPAVSTDGRRIAFTDAEEDYDLAEIALDGTPQRPVLSTARTEADPAWSPMGGQYAYVTDRTGSQEIWLRSAEGSFERPIVTEASFRKPRTLLLSGLAFAPDGQRLAYQRRGLEGFQIWISTVAGGSAVRLTRDEGYEDAPTWSPDGNWIAFSSLRGGRWALAKASAGGGEPPATIKEGIVYPSNPRWSPRGDWITCELPEGFAVVSPDGAQTRILAEETWLVHAWSRDGSSIYAVRQNEEQQLELVALDLASGAVRMVTRSLGAAPPSSFPLRGFSLSPDGPRFLTSLYRLRGDLWLLEGFDAPRRSALDFGPSAP